MPCRHAIRHLEKFYDLERYIVKTFIGQRTFAYHSSLGCPNNCSFCGVATVFNGSWKGKSAEKMADDIITFKNIYQIDAIEILDSNFFSSTRSYDKFLPVNERTEYPLVGRGSHRYTEPVHR